jgi:hypothetical protein
MRQEQTPILMRALYHAGYQLAEKGYSWHKYPPGHDDENDPFRTKLSHLILKKNLLERRGANLEL